METEEDSKVHPSSHPQPPPPQRPTSPQPARSGTVAEPSKDLLKMERIDDDARKQKMYQSFLIKEHKTERVKPSPLLDRVRNFLPLMSAANEELNRRIKREGKKAVDIENVTSESSPHVAMDLFVPGVVADKFYESKSHEGDDSSMNSSSSSSSSSSNSSSSSSSSDNDSDEEEFYDEKNERIVKVEMPDAGTRPQVDGIFHKKPKIKEVK